jgi:hypothetical protein
MSVARMLSSLNNDMTFCYVSGLGTDSSEQGRSMWARVKGKTENDLKTMPFKSALLFRPGFIKPIPGQKRAFLASKIIGGIYPLLNAVASKFVCTMNDIGLAMVGGTLAGLPTQILENRDITRVATESRTQH